MPDQSAPNRNFRRFAGILIVLVVLAGIGSWALNSQNTPQSSASAGVPASALDGPKPTSEPINPPLGPGGEFLKDPLQGDKISVEDCGRFAAHFYALMMKGQEGQAALLNKQVFEGMREDLIRDCTERGTRAEIDCSLKATAIEELEKCGSFEKGSQ